MRDYVPNERIVDRAVELWKRALANPVYRNTMPHEPEHAQNEALNAMLATLPKNNTPEILDCFGVALKAALMTPVRSKHVDPYYQTYLGVDYHPDQMLREAAETAGLKMEFPVKTNMHLAENYVSFAMGYGARHKYHYPLDDGLWLVTSLHGSREDIDALIRYANNGGYAGYFSVE